VRYVQIEGLPAISKIGLGTIRFGERSYDPATAQAVVNRALELGITLFDTAENYGFGRGERLLGRALGDQRDDVVITTKFFPFAPLPSVTTRHARTSRERLGLAQIPLYLLHMPNPMVPDRVIMRGLRQAQDEGVISSAGVSNYKLAQWVAAEAAMRRPVVANQVMLNLLHRQPTADMVPWAAEHKRLVIASSPLAQGMLSGRYDEQHPPRDHRGHRRLLLRFSAFPPRSENLRRFGPVVTLLRDIGTGHGVTPAAVALAWIIEHGPVVAIPAASSIDQLEANAAAADMTLTDDEHSALTDAAERFRG
jgi:aryl-alcohol dehydrogenase-like predicted oxidoreductase